MPKVIFEFKTDDERSAWLGAYHDGGGEQEVMESFSCNDEEYPEIKITEED